MLQFLVSLNPSKHQLQRAILAPKWNRKVSLGASWVDGAVCRGFQATEQLQVQPLPEAPAPWVLSDPPPPSDPMPLHKCTPGDDTCLFTCVCLYCDLAMISYTQPAISNSTELSQTHLATKSYMTWTQMVAGFTRIDRKQSIILFIPSRVDIIFHRNHPDFIERVLPQTPPRVWPNM